MKPFLAVTNEINRLPGGSFNKRIAFRRLSVEINRTCTNTCVHCNNYGSPEDESRMEKEQIFDLVSSAKKAGMNTLHLWGGEPFLHPDIDEIINSIFDTGLHLMVSTNGFWAISPSATEDHVNRIMKHKPENSYFEIIASCDGLHQSFPQTPIDNIANIANYVTDRFDPKVILLINSCDLAGDSTFDRLFPLLHNGVHATRKYAALTNNGATVSVLNKGQHPVLLSRKFPVDLSVGRARSLSPALRSSGPITPDMVNSLTSCIFDNTLYVGIDGTSFFSPHHLGDRIFPWKNVFNSSISEVISDANADNVIQFLFSRPFSSFVGSFQKHLNVYPLIENSHTFIELFNRLYLAEG